MPNPPQGGMKISCAHAGSFSSLCPLTSVIVTVGPAPGGKMWAPSWRALVVKTPNPVGRLRESETELGAKKTDHSSSASE
eukprot:CAMPEP_0113552210 /NCGR_PEP_ID=MMETSP0015_2-20120614/14942_1 /TAXON_ID=2838 /ORGANISM="Odontella" /LENGTH=79 /DNA_ID=CAMNT_0000453165 /DNA_START=1384 /DNA_END=1623 /DNA_ORIENTATION=- /assembly_acc=CAM_ASM_000160